ncbi:MAG TPA: TetR family transcriptional regulator [Nitrospirae bacterium]|nr:TetR family transcriptional regulator [Nitrospirota bacterium]
MSSEATKKKITEAGTAIVHARGFRATGIQEVLDRAGVPKGSFYFYFKNKDAFGLALVEHFSEFWLGRMDEFLLDEGYSPLVRLARFFGFFHAMFEDMGYRQGCPIGNMAQEMADISEEFKDKVGAVMREAQGKMAQCLREAQEAGEVSSGLDVDAAAEFLLNAWEGAILRMKAEGGPGPLNNFEHMVFRTILRA